MISGSLIPYVLKKYIFIHASTIQVDHLSDNNQVNLLILKGDKKYIYIRVRCATLLPPVCIGKGLIVAYEISAEAAIFRHSELQLINAVHVRVYAIDYAVITLFSDYSLQ